MGGGLCIELRVLYAMEDYVYMVGGVYDRG